MLFSELAKRVAEKYPEVKTVYPMDCELSNVELYDPSGAVPPVDTLSIYTARQISEDMTLPLGTSLLTVWSPLLPESDDANENGLIIAASQDDFEAFILGDAPSKAEKALITSAPMPDAEVLFVAHHGSNTSTCKELLEAITPETAVISVGYNTYGHPTQKVLDRLAKHEITVLRTDTDGEITIAAGEG